MAIQFYPFKATDNTGATGSFPTLEALLGWARLRFTAVGSPTFVTAYRSDTGKRFELSPLPGHMGAIKIWEGSAPKGFTPTVATLDRVEAMQALLDASLALYINRDSARVASDYDGLGRALESLGFTFPPNTEA